MKKAKAVKKTDKKGVKGVMKRSDLGIPKRSDIETGEPGVNRPDVTNDMIAELMKENMGFKSVVSEALGITVKSICERIRKDKSLQDVLHYIHERRLDVSESKLSKLIKANDFQAIKYHLDSQGKDRGYGRTLDNGGGDTYNIQLRQEVINLQAKLSLPEMKQLRELVKKGGGG